MEFDGLMRYLESEYLLGEDLFESEFDLDFDLFGENYLAPELPPRWPSPSFPNPPGLPALFEYLQAIVDRLMPEDLSDDPDDKKKALRDAVDEAIDTAEAVEEAAEAVEENNKDREAAENKNKGKKSSGAGNFRRYDEKELAKRWGVSRGEVHDIVTEIKTEFKTEMERKGFRNGDIFVKDDGTIVLVDRRDKTNYVETDAKLDDYKR
jgi:hypothetical protein